MADAHKYQAHEILNKVLNAAETGLQVDIVAGAEYAEDAAHTDEDTGNFVLGVRNDTLGTLGDASGDYVPFQMNASGALYVEVSSVGGYSEDVATPSTISGSAIMIERDDALGSLTPAEGDWVSLRCDAKGALWTRDDGLDAAIDGAFINVNANIDGTDFIGGAGAVAAGVQRVTLASDDPAVASLDEIEDAIEVIETTVGTDGSTGPSKTLSVGGTESGGNIQELRVDSDGHLQVDVLSAASTAVTNAGTFAVQSTLQAADGVDIGNVDVASVVPGYAATNLGKREDDAHSNLDVGVMSLAVRNDDVAAIGSADGDYAPLQVNAAGSLYTTDATGEAGSILVTGTAAVVASISNTCFVAIQFLEDTIFDSGTQGLVATDDTLYPDDNGTGAGISSGGGGANSDGVTFPQGMTIFGRWSGFKLTSTGAVVAYIGYI